jgi:ankyrin repeat protein
MMRKELLRIILKLIVLILWGMQLAVVTGCSNGIQSAVERGDVETVARMLTETPGIIGEFDDEGKTLLHRAALQGRVNVAQLLLNRGAKIDERSRDGNSVTPLHLAASGGHLEMVKQLLRSGADVKLTASSDFFRWDALMFAIEGNHKEMVEFLLANGAFAGVTGAMRVKINPLLFAARRGNVEIAEMLLNNGAEADINNRIGGDTLHEAVYVGNYDVVELLLRRGADISTRTRFGKTPLHLMLYWKKERSKLVKLLLENGADVDAIDINKNTPLHIAAYNGFIESAKLLLERGASPNRKNGKGLTSSDIAGRRGHGAVWRLFKSLHNTTQAGDYNAAAGIVKKYPQLIHLEDDEGKTPLILAVEGNHLKIAGMLIANGADVNTSSKFKKIQLLHGMVAKIIVPKVGRIKYVEDVKTPLQIADTKNFTGMAQLLRTKGATK